MPAAYAQRVSEIADDIEADGYYSDFPLNDSERASISRANEKAIAFLELDQDGEQEAEQLAERLLQEFATHDSRYDTIIVLFQDAIFVDSLTHSSDVLERSVNPGNIDFENDSLHDLIDAVSSPFPTSDRTTSRTDNDLGNSSQGLDDSSTPEEVNSATSSGGFKLRYILVPLLLLGGVFWVFASRRRKKKAAQRQAADMAADKAEIRQQLQDNSDRVIELGDQVIASKNSELQGLYEQASQSYQQVSLEIDAAATPAQVDALDDKIDTAQWQFETIEARLAGQPDPPSPQEIEQEAAKKQSEEDTTPALGKDESVFTSPRSGREYQRRTRRSSGGGLGSLGKVLGGILMGGGGLGMPSRRTQQRRSSSDGFGSRPKSGGFGRRQPSSSRGRGAGRSFGRRTTRRSTSRSKGGAGRTFSRRRRR